MRPIKEPKKVTRADLVHFRYDKGDSLMPQPISFKIVSALVREQLETLNRMKGDEDSRAVITEAAENIRVLIEESDEYDGFFIPIKIGDHTKHIAEQYSRERVVKEHLVDEKGNREFSDEDTLKSADFIEAAYGALLEHSHLISPSKKKAIQIVQDALSEIGRRKLSNATKNEKKASDESAAQPSPGSQNEDTSPGKSPGSPT